MNVAKRRSRSSRGLKIEDWPKVDRVAWRRASRSGGLSQCSGRASELVPVSRRALVSAYGLFLGYLRHKIGYDALVKQRVPMHLLTAENIAGYLKTLMTRVSSVTVYNSVSHLRRMAIIMRPRGGYAWLQEIERDLGRAARPSTKRNRVVETSVLLNLGFSLMRKSSAERLSITSAISIEMD